MDKMQEMVEREVEYREKIKQLELDLVEKQEEVEKYQRWWKKESEKASEYLMYKTAFRALVKELRG